MLAGLLFFVALILLRNDPASETSPAETFAYWQDDRGRHQIIGLIVVPLIACLLIFFAAGLRGRLQRGNGDSGHGSVAFGGALLAAATFALVGMLEAAMTNAAHEGDRQAVYTLSQLHSYDWLAWNVAFAALLLATGIGARRNGMLPAPLGWVTIVMGAALLTPVGFFRSSGSPLPGGTRSRCRSQRGISSSATSRREACMRASCSAYRRRTGRSRPTASPSTACATRRSSSTGR